MRTAIITDSNSGIFEQEARQLGIYTVPMPVILDGETCYEGTTLTHTEFFGRLKQKAQASTSQPAPQNVIRVWEQAVSDGYDEIVYIPMSSGLTGGVQTAKLLAEDYPGTVYVVDNHRIAITQRHSVQDAIVLRDQGRTGAQIKARLEETAYASLVYVGVQDLEFLRRGGRITPAAQTMGTLLKLKPLLVIRGDKLDAYAKVRGVRQCMEREIRAMHDFSEELKGKGRPVYISAAGSFAEDADAAAWYQMVQAAFPEDKVDYDPLTFSVSCHVGPDAFGMGVSIRL